MDSSHSQKLPEDIGFLFVVFGGIGRDAAAEFHQRYVRDAGPFPMKLLQIDTDPATADFFDYSLCPRLNAEMLAAMQADPSKFGPEVPIILQRYRKFLNPEDLANGSRTIRSLTQLAWAFHRDSINTTLRMAIQDLFKTKPLTAVVPIFASSSGGGCGSAAQILAMREFMHPEFRHMLLEGMSSSMMMRPVSFVVEPYALAQRHPSTQPHPRQCDGVSDRVRMARTPGRDKVRLPSRIDKSPRHDSV
ncbi:MAG TPA: hypothetical protein VK137_05270 [Planctomycetaceae bacterium]|nr:hypothetical protein [Planctomycetaceae bacterium]